MDVLVLQLKYTFDDQEKLLYPVLLKDDEEMLLVDCGYPGSLPMLEEAIREKGNALKDLTGIIITHHDLDHMGAL